MKIIHRKISEEEATIVRKTILQASSVSIEENILSTIDKLNVVGRCDCGCASIDFEQKDESIKSRPIADALGLTKAGGQVGIIVWGTENIITGLEIYDIGAGQEDLGLPIPDSIHPFEK